MRKLEMTHDSANTTAREPHEAPTSHDELFRLLPSVNEVLLRPEVQPVFESFSRHRAISAIREALGILRQEIAASQHTTATLNSRLVALPDEIARRVNSPREYSLRSVINATGVVLHTNLGRSPLSQAALDHIVEVAQGYCNLELDLETGRRSRRDIHAEAALLRVLNVTDAELYGVVVVNNCAAATFMALNTLAEKQEVVVSRGELVEIGGGFRIPEILEKSGAVLKEIGTTNRTRLSDYERAIGPATALILRVHQSNFSIEGFAERAVLGDLVALSRRAGIPLFEDQGTGLISSLEDYGVRGEPSLQASFEQGVDLVAASGDKLLGGPQCGLLVGRADLVQKIQKNPLLRAFRVDKLTYAALEATLMEYLSGQEDSLPLIRMLSVPPEEIMGRCRQIADKVKSPQMVVDVVPVESLIGGGTAPKAVLPSCAISLRHASLSADQLSSALRRLDPPVIGRISDDVVLLDLRTVDAAFDATIAASLNGL
ncbi:MAG: L-seryl-tRNA(Sec) selenium transferase [Proteobacteria bacterium]|nr:MAG: L-seryl-tRNA(Sec) selenium transferase [Pseudomonadota bacterium]